MTIIKRYAIPFFLLTLLTASVYGGTLNYPFVFDDFNVVVQNPALRDISNIPRFFTTLGPRGKTDTTGLYRPIVFSSFTINYLLSGPNTFSYHLFDVFLHIINSFMLFLVITALQKAIKHENPAIAFLFSALFCVHPVLTQSVIYISARSVLIMTFFCLGSLLAYLKYKATDKALMLAFSAFLFACALLTKESAPPFVVVIILTEFYFQRKNRDRLRTAVMRIIPFVAAAAIFIAVRSYFLSKAAVTLLGGGYVSHWLAEISVVPRYLLVILYPPQICIDHYIPDVQLSDPILWAGAGIIAALALVLYIILRKDALLACLLAWPLFALLPEMILPVPERMVEYRLYLPMAGLMAFLCVAYSKWYVGASRTATRAVTAVMLVSLATLGIFAYEAGKVWASPISIWQDAVRKNPYNSRAHYNLGVAYSEEGSHLKSEELMDNAIKEFRQALKISPGYAEAHNYLGIDYAAKGMGDKAIEEYQFALKILPAFADAHYNMGTAYGAKGLLDKAIDELQIALTIKPYDADAYYFLGNAFAAKGMFDKAIEEYKLALEIRDDDADIHYNLANSFVAKGMLDVAIEEYKAALRLRPGYAKAHYNLGQALLQSGFAEDAIKELEYAARLKPDDPEIRNELDLARARTGMVR